MGAAIWLGGSLMGAVALNGTTSDVSNPRERATLAAGGWARWSPVNAAAIGAHLLGGLGLALTDRREAGGRGATVTMVKAVATGLAMAATAYSGALGAKIAAAGYVPSDAATTPGEETPNYVAAAQDRLRKLQWIIPALTGLIVVLGAEPDEPEQPAGTRSGRALEAARRMREVVRR